MMYVAHLCDSCYISIGQCLGPGQMSLPCAPKRPCSYSWYNTCQTPCNHQSDPLTILSNRDCFLKGCLVSWSMGHPCHIITVTHTEGVLPKDRWKREGGKGKATWIWAHRRMQLHTREALSGQLRGASQARRVRHSYWPGSREGSLLDQWLE